MGKEERLLVICGGMGMMMEIEEKVEVWGVWRRRLGGRGKSWAEVCGGCTACSSLMRPLTFSSCNKQGQENDEEAPGVGDCTHCIENYFSIVVIFSTDLVCPSDDHLFLSLSITIYISLSSLLIFTQGYFITMFIFLASFLDTYPIHLYANYANLH